MHQEYIHTIFVAAKKYSGKVGQLQVFSGLQLSKKTKEELFLVTKTNK